MPIMICTGCGCQMDFAAEEAAFCVKCGCRLRPADELERAIESALSEKEIPVRYRRLLQLREAYPNEYKVEFEILCIGRMHERGGRPDFYRIPFWPLTAFETPEQFSGKERGQMLKSFFENPEAERVAALSDDPQEFRRAYYLRMARGFVDICLKGKYENGGILGFRRKPADIMKRCAPQVRKMIVNLEKAQYPDEGSRRLLAVALRHAFIAEFEGLDAQLYLEDSFLFS